MNPRIPIGVVPMDLTILMPGDRGTETRFLYKQDLVEGREVGTIDGFGHPQQIWMPVDTQERLTDFEAAADEKRHVGRGHLRRAPARASSLDAGRSRPACRPKGR